MKTKNLVTLSKESIISKEIQPKIDSIINEIMNDISNKKYDKLISEFFGTTESTKNQKGEEIKLLSYFILEILWLYEIIRRTNEIKFKVEKNNQIVSDVKILIKDYGFNIFPIKIISELTPKLTENIVSTLDDIEKSYLEKGKVDLRGVIFQNLLPEKLRKITGSYHTRSDAAEILASLVIDNKNETILDLSCGSGKLLVASHHRLKELQNNDKQNFLEQIFGIELMQIPAVLTVLNLFLENPDVKTPINIGVGDSLFLEPSSEFIPLKSNLSKIKLNKTDVVIMNPPFTRQEYLKKEQKEEIFLKFKKYKEADKRFGLHGYFILQGNEFLKEGGKIGLVLPATVLRIESFGKLREFLVNNFQIKYIIVSNNSSSFSYGSRFREILLIGEKQKPKTTDKIRLAILNKSPENEKTIKQIVSDISGKAIKSSSMMKVIDIQYDLFQKNSYNLFKFISLSNTKIFNIYSRIFNANKNIIRIKDYCKNHGYELIRGWETLRSQHPIQSDFILLNKEEVDEKSPWYLVKNNESEIIAHNYIENKEIKIPSSCIKHGLRRLGDIDTIDASGKLDYIVSKSYDRIHEFLPEPLVANFSEWEKITMRKSSKLAFVRRFNLAGPKMKVCAIVSNEEFTPTQTLSIITGISDEEAKINALWMNSTLHILQMVVERVETEGSYMELPEWAMKDLFIINTNALTKKQQSSIISLYEKISKIPFPSIMSQLKKEFQIRDDIDELFLDILGIKEINVKEFQNIVYSEISELKLLVKSND